jgi:hypothetical protein
LRCRAYGGILDCIHILESSRGVSMRVPDPPKDSVYVLSAVPPKSSRLLQKYGLLSGVETIKHPSVLKAARPDAKQRKAFVKKVEEVIASDRPYSVMGPSVFFTPPDPDKITAKHFIKQWDLQTIRIDLSRLVEDHPETVVWGAELLPYAYAWRKMSDEEFDEEIAELGFSSWEEYRDARSRPLTLDEVYDFTQADPVELWEHYHKSDIGKKYASNVPHAFIITPMGYIPYEYIEYVDNARSNPLPLDCHKYAHQIFAHLYRARLANPHLFTHVEIITKPFYFVHFTNYEEIIALEGFYGRSDELIDTKRTFGELVRDGHVFAFRLNANSLRGSLQELQEMFDAAEDETQHIFDWSPIGMYGIGLVISKAEMGVDMFHPGDQEIQTIIPIACIDESEMLVVSDFFEQYGLEEAF